MYVINFIRGFCMALADTVPGVSGGTIAFILGFYDKFIDSLNNLISGTKEERIESVTFLIKLGIGWVTGLILSVLFITSLFESHIYEISSLFLGFIIMAIPLIYKEEKETLKGNIKNIIFIFIGIIIVWAITYFNPLTHGREGAYISLDNLSFNICLYIFVSGMIAISAMVLPGISGSTILLIFGLYAPIMNSIKGLLKMNFNYLPIVIIFGFGVIAGIMITIKGVKKALANHRSKTIYCILGLMIGSLYAVVMGPTSLKIHHAPMSISSFSIIFFILGVGIIIGLQKLKVLLEK